MSYDEGLAIHISPESCAGNGNIAGEALTERLEKIGEEFNLNNYSSVSNAISRVKRRLRNNKFKKRYGQIFDSL